MNNTPQNKYISITITESAKKYFHNLITNNKEKTAIKISIKKSGCAGFKYDLSFIKLSEYINNKDFYILNDYIKICIPIKYMSLIDGTLIDCIQEDKINTIITFKNDKIQQFCGCGESFNIK